MSKRILTDEEEFTKRAKRGIPGRGHGTQVGMFATPSSRGLNAQQGRLPCRTHVQEPRVSGESTGVGSLLGGQWVTGGQRGQQDIKDAGTGGTGKTVRAPAKEVCGPSGTGVYKSCCKFEWADQGASQVRDEGEGGPEDEARVLV